MSIEGYAPSAGLKLRVGIQRLKMEASCFFCGGISTLALKSPSCLRFRLRHNVSNPPPPPSYYPFILISQFSNDGRAFSDSLSSTFRSQQFILNSYNSSSSGGSTKTSSSKRRSRNNKSNSAGSRSLKGTTSKSVPTAGLSALVPADLDAKQGLKQPQQPNRSQLPEVKKNRPINVRALYQNGDPLGWRDLGKCVVKWICQGMKAMASDFATAEVQGEFSEVKQRMGPGLTFVIQAQPYLNAVPMPLGFEAVCLKACTHYPTLFDHFQRELRDVLQDLQRKSLLNNWRDSDSWKLLKELASSAQHRAIARKVSLPKTLHGGLGMDLEKAKAIQSRIDDYTKRMSHLLRIERDAELEFTQEELNAIPTPDESSDSPKPTEFLVTHGQAEQELCDTICNLNAVSTSTGLGGMHLVLFRVEGDHRLPPTTLSPGDMVCVRICDSRGAGATSCMQGFINNLGEDGCSISVALESRHGDPTFSKLFGKSVRIDRIHGLADALTYERNCEALMLLQKKGLQKKNPSIAVVATLFGDKEDVAWLEENQLIDWDEAELDGLLNNKTYDDSQRRAIVLGLNKKRPILIVQGPPGTGKSSLLKELILLAVKQGERVLVTAPTNAAVDNMVEKLSNIAVDIVRVGNPARISPAVASKSLVEVVNTKLANFRIEFERKKSDLRKDLRHCLNDDSLAAGIRQLLKQLGKTFKKKEKEAVKEILSSAQVVLATNTGAADPLIRRLDTFDLVVIDEAGQAIEPSCWIPILQGKRCILAGDQYQLAPVILSRKALEGGLGISLLERAATLHEGVLATKLTTQYRMNDAIASWASKEMYGGSLKSSSTVSCHLLVDSPFVKPTWITQCPLLLLDTRMPYGSLFVGCEEHLDPAGTGSFYNEGEGRYCCAARLFFDLCWC
ncbi:hypothetical protein F0562_026849 [Nyssa sinensis]|uniref:Helicase ATP-binding domain-containing protein n=1 Tax=Nyssa sinensis TaxID=561372 RepID=A0A5J5BEP9_9ASTE|nr:hypothetical protein F0562_026849 [Nyssa sinensis]